MAKQTGSLSPSLTTGSESTLPVLDSGLANLLFNKARFHSADPLSVSDDDEDGTVSSPKKAPTNRFPAADPLYLLRGDDVDVEKYLAAVGFDDAAAERVLPSILITAGKASDSENANWFKYEMEKTEEEEEAEAVAALKEAEMKDKDKKNGVEIPNKVGLVKGDDDGHIN